MNICISVDDHYIKPTLVMLNSLFIHNRKNKIHLYVLYTETGLTKQRRMEIVRLTAIFHVCVDFVSVRDNCFDGAPLVDYISITTYYRLMAMDLIQVNKILYLDTDLVVTGDLRELYETDMKNKAFAGVRVHSKERKRKLGITGGYSYINAGVLLMNLSWLRKHTTRNEILSYIAQNWENLRLADQDVINGLFYKNNKVLPVRYNYCPYKNKEYFKFKKDLAVKPVIYHYRGIEKPWQLRYRGYGKAVYWKYVNRDSKEYTCWQVGFHIFIGNFWDIVGYCRQKFI